MKVPQHSARQQHGSSRGGSGGRATGQLAYLAAAVLVALGGFLRLLHFSDSDAMQVVRRLGSPRGGDTAITSRGGRQHHTRPHSGGSEGTGAHVPITLARQLSPAKSLEVSSTAVAKADPSVPDSVHAVPPALVGGGVDVGHEAKLSGESVEGAGAREGRKYHVVVSTDGNHYTTWQTRIMYYWYRKSKAAFPDSDMGGFTRLLHSGQPDRWMEEIPTIVVDGLAKELADPSYPVLNRPFAFRQWLAGLDIREDYILMAEPDHLIIKPPPNWASPDRPAGYPFTYMNPKKFASELRGFERLGSSNHTRGVERHMDPVGNSPVIIHKQQLQRIVPLWTELSLKMKQSPAVNRALGWVQEMYAFSLASAIVDQQPIRYDMHMEFMLQPPFDMDLRVRCWPPNVIKQCPMRDAHIIHYTYGMDVDPTGHFTPGKRGYWHWDKRDYISRNVPGHIRPPPPGTGESIVKMVAMLNEASQALWPSGIM